MKLYLSVPTAIEAVQELSKSEVDVLFLDINMPNMSGIELLRQLRVKPLTILTTAYSEYALESYDHDVVDYLLKPIDLGRFTKAMTKIMNRLNENENIAIAENTFKDDSFFVKADHKKIKIEPAKILYIEAMEKYVIIHFEGKKVMTLMSMTNIQNQLNENIFLRVHRSYIVNKNAVSELEGNLAIIGTKKVPISKANKQKIHKVFNLQ